MKRLIDFTKSENGLIVKPYLLIWLSLFASCKEQKTNEASTSNMDTSMVTSSNVKHTIQKLQNEEDTNSNYKFEYLECSVSDLKQLYNNKQFVKFRFLPYKPSPEDDFSLFCYALSKDVTDDETDDTPYRFGNPVFIPNSNAKLGNPEYSDDATIYAPPFALSKGQMDTIFKLTNPQNRGFLISFQPQEVIDVKGNKFETYEIFKDHNDSKMHMNPSPPSLTNLLKKKLKKK